MAYFPLKRKSKTMSRTRKYNNKIISNNRERRSHGQHEGLQSRHSGVAIVVTLTERELTVQSGG